MTDTIRERIISAIVTALAAVRTANGYATEAGAAVYRCEVALDPESAPFLNVFPQPETVEHDRYGNPVHTMPVIIEAVAEFDETPSEVAEQLLGDLIECGTGVVYYLPFTGGKSEIKAGDTITGATSGATAYVSAVSVTSGAWAELNAAGTLTLKRLAKVFQTEALNVGAVASASTTGAITGQYPEARMTAGLADSIRYTAGGVSEYPHRDKHLTGQQITLEIVYTTSPGNPY